MKWKWGRAASRFSSRTPTAIRSSYSSLRTSSFAPCATQGGVMQLKIVNPSSDYSKVPLIEPTRLGYLYLAASVRPSRIPWMLPSGTRARLLRQMKQGAEELERIDGVLKATVFRAIVRPPTARFSGYLKERAPSLRPANFDVLVLVETRTADIAESLRRSSPFLTMRSALEREASRVFIMTARN